MSFIAQLNADLNMAEARFNLAGSLPVVAIASGAVRMVAGAVQGVAGAALVNIGLIGLAISRESK